MRPAHGELPGKERGFPRQERQFTGAAFCSLLDHHSVAATEGLAVPCAVLSDDLAAGYMFRRRGTLKQGIGVSRMDLLIASVALANNLTLVTHNTADYRNIPGLRLDDWLIP